MSLVRRLFLTGSLTESLGIYVSMTVLQRGLGLVRVFVLTWLLTVEQYGLWGLGAMLFAIGAPIVTLGSTGGVERYVSLFEARGRLRAFYRMMRWSVPVLALVLTSAALLASDGITSLIFAAGKGPHGVTGDHQKLICWAAIANALLLALYLNMLAFPRGMRAHRAVSAVEILFGLTFTAMALVVLVVAPTGLAVLLAHAAAMVISLAAGMVLLHLGLEASASFQPQPPGTDEANRLAEGGGTVPLPNDVRRPRMLLRLLAYGLVSLLGTLLWTLNTHISFYLTSTKLDKCDAGVFYAFMRLSQPLVLLAGAAWTVLFVHVARHWEIRDRSETMMVLETAYKAIAMSVMTLAVLVYAFSPLWVRTFKSEYRDKVELVGPLLMYFQAMAGMAMMAMLAKLRERPMVIAVAAVVAGAANVALAEWWIPIYGVAGAAYAAGVGMFLGVTVVSLSYLVAIKAGLQWRTIAVLALPAALLLPRWAAVGLWLAILGGVACTPLMFDKAQKRLLWAGLKAGINSRRRGRP